MSAITQWHFAKSKGCHTDLIAHNIAHYMLEGTGQLCAEHYFVAILELVRTSKINIDCIGKKVKDMYYSYLIRRKSIR
jgi:hypothetical protein